MVSKTPNAVPALPLSALYKDQETFYTFVHEKNTAVRKDIELGLIGHEYAYVKKGVSSKDKVIDKPSKFLVEGMFVKRK